MTLPANIAAWPPRWQELFTERAGIMEFDAKLSRDQAELLAESEIRRQADREAGRERARA